MKYMFFLLAVFCLSSCEDLRFGDAFLAMPPGTADDLEFVYSTRENAEKALMSAYRTLPDGLPQIYRDDQKLTVSLLESLTDINNTTKTWGAVEEMYYSGQISASSPSFLTKFNYDKGMTWTGIRAAWMFIENVHRVPDMSEQQKAVRIAEAKTIIAIHYIELLRNYGGVPKVDHVYLPDDELRMPRMTVAQTVDFIVGLLDEAIGVLPWTVLPIDDGRMTKAAAMGLKIRTLLFAASPLFNDDEPFTELNRESAELWWYGNKDQGRWQKVVDAGQEFMAALEAEGYYHLVNTGNPRADFKNAYFKRANHEVLVSTRRVPKYKGGSPTIFVQPNFGMANTTLDYVDMFPMTDGTDFSWDKPEHAAFPFFDPSGLEIRDPRLYETVLIPNDRWGGRVAQTWIGGRERQREQYQGALCSSGFCIRKFRDDIKSVQGQFYSWPYLRLPEVYLSIAEALNETDRTEEAYEYVRLVRDRAGLPNVRSGMSKEEFREALLRERALEFGYEEVRFYDLIRWKRDDIFRKKLRGLDTRQTGGAFTYKQFMLPNPRPWQGDGWNSRLYLSAFPVTEINKKYGLIQNPGW